MRRRPGILIRVITAGVILLQIGAIFWAGAAFIRYYLNLLLPAVLQGPIAASPTPAVTNPPQAAASVEPSAAPSATPTLIGLATASLITPTPPSPYTLCSPLKGVRIQELRAILSDGYHPPPPGRDGRHMGVDFAFYTNSDGKKIEGFEANAILPGRAACVVFDRPPFGNAVILETRFEDVGAQEAEWLHITKEQSLYHLYAHLGNAPAVDPNNHVDCGQFLGRVGDSGASGNPHLHLETRYGPPGATFPVLAYDISASPQIGVTTDEKTNYFNWATSGTFPHFDPMNLFSSYIAIANPGYIRINNQENNTPVE